MYVCHEARFVVMIESRLDLDVLCRYFGMFLGTFVGFTWHNVDCDYFKKAVSSF